MLREKILLNQNWSFMQEPKEIPVPKSKAAAYISAKTERLKWGPGTYHHMDIPGYGSFGNEISAERWERVDLPHDYIIRQNPDKEENGALGFFKYFPAWYRKHFTIGEEDKTRRISIYFEGITGISDVYLNGCFLKHNNGSYVSFEVDITDIVRFDEENVLAVRVDPSSNETWWYAGGGIYRNVWLVKTDHVSVDLWGVYVNPVKKDAHRWTAVTEVSLRNTDYNDYPVKIGCSVIAPDGEKVDEIQMKGTATARTKTVLHGTSLISDPALWDVDCPKQYTLSVTVSKKINGRFRQCDHYEQKFGFREIILDPDKGLILNGRPLKIKGICAHQDFGLTGLAVPDNICRYKVRLFKEMGCNGFRTSHYPHQEAFMDACDAEGLLVLDETRRFESNPEALEQLRMMVLRDRNRPSVFMWSTGNEEVIYQALPQGRRILKAMISEIRKLDPVRPITSVTTDIDHAVIYDLCDAIGVNYGLHLIDKVRAKYPDKTFFSTEISAMPSCRGWYYGNSPSDGLCDARDQEPAPGSFQGHGRELSWKCIAERDWDAGCFQWAGTEHRGEAIWPRLCSVSGALDLFLQRKDAFYQNQSHWLDRPMIHVLPHWNHPGMEGCPVNVWVYTNCEEAELFLNGKSHGRKKVKKYLHLEWNVKYASGRLEVVGYNKGKACVKDTRETTGPAVALRLELNNGDDAAANGQDIAVYSCTAIDARGREVPDAEPLVSFHCIGNGLIVGTGSSITDHVPVPSTVRKMYAGIISVAVKIQQAEKGHEKVPVLLIARSENLKSAYLKVELPGKTKTDK